jgi:carbon monoxide dehydrogenase subunit G
MLGKILVGVVALVVVFIAVVATRPSAYHVERRLDIAAPPEVVFGILNDLRQFAGVLVMFGNPWQEADPAMKQSFDGPASGVGQSYAWDSAKDVGKGRMAIAASEPDRRVAIRLDFEKPMKSTAMFHLGLAPTPTGTTVSWAMDGNHNFVGKAFGLFMNMDRMLGNDIDKGLARLKGAAEQKAAALAHH